MGILQYFLICLIVGLVIWVIHAFTPIPAPIKKLILWAGVIVLILILCSALGLFGHDVAIPKLR